MLPRCTNATFACQFSRCHRRRRAALDHKTKRQAAKQRRPAMAANLHSHFTIDDFPDEVIERFLPDQRPRTVSTFRLVSRRFSQVFSADRYFRRYLIYADRLGLYRADLEEIGDSRDRWRRCLEAEKRRLAAWRLGSFKRVRTVELPENVRRNFSGYKRECMADEDNEHWMLFYNAAPELLLVNVTDEPVMSTRDISDYTGTYGFQAFLAPGQAFVRPTLDSGSALHVFNLGKTPDGVSLQFKFSIQYDFYSDAVVVSGNSSVTGGRRNLVVSHTFGLWGFEINGALHVWDSTAGVELEQISFRDLSPLRARYGDRPQPPRTRPLGIRPGDFTKAENVVAGPFPNVLVCTLLSPIAMINVEKKQLTHMFEGTLSHRISQCAVYGSTFCFESHAHNSDFTLSLYRLDRKLPEDGFFLEMEPIYRTEVARFQTANPGLNFCLGDRMLVMVNISKKIHLVEIDGVKTTERVIRLPQRLTKFTPFINDVPEVAVGPFAVFTNVEMNLLSPNQDERIVNKIKACDSSMQELFYLADYSFLCTGQPADESRCDIQSDNLFRIVLVGKNARLRVFHF